MNNNIDTLFYNLNCFIQDSNDLINVFRFRNNIKNYDDLEIYFKNYFIKYSNKAEIVKGITSSIINLELLNNKLNWLRFLFKDSQKIANKIEVKNVIDDDDSFLEFSIKSIIENRVLPLIEFIIVEIELTLKSSTPKKTIIENEKIIDFSDSKGTEKIIILSQLGILDFLKEKQPFNVSTNALASALSGVTGIKTGTLQSYINPIFNPNIEQKNNPLKKEKSVTKINQKLISIGFNPPK